MLAESDLLQLRTEVGGKLSIAFVEVLQRRLPTGIAVHQAFQRALKDDRLAASVGPVEREVTRCTWPITASAPPLGCANNRVGSPATNGAGAMAVRSLNAC